MGSIGIPHLEEFWRRYQSVRNGERSVSDAGESWVADQTLLAGLQIGLRETLDFLYRVRPALAEFEAWILQKNGGFIEPQRVARINAALRGDEIIEPLCESIQEPVLSADDLAFWDENGYVILHDAAPPEQCEAAERAIYEFLEMDRNNPETWYSGVHGHSIWVPVIHHPALWANRRSPRIHRAYAQLWGRTDLWVNADQSGLNPPERPGWSFPGPWLHWDTSLAQPIPFGTQGILYLTDTAANQGAFQCVPGFHRKVVDWLENLPPGADPRKQDLTALGPVPVAGRAGDFIIWHHALPHGSSPNRASRPRVVQYMNLFPNSGEYQKIWI